MKAVVLEGVKQSLVIKELPVPTLAAGDALVRIHAASFNRRDWWIREGLYAGLKFPIVLGSDGSGIVELVGHPGNGGWLGREVIIDPSLNWGVSEACQGNEFQILGLPQDGTFAAYVRIPVSNLLEKPRHLSFEEAAALPLGGVTAYRALFSRAQLRIGERVLLVGAGGGVASFALQFAVRAGAQVWVTSSSEAKLAKAVELGAQGGVLYTDDDWKQQLLAMVDGFDVIVDSALGDAFAHHLDLADPGARIVFFGGTAGNLPALNARKIFWKQLAILGTTMGSPADFADMAAFVSRHRIRPVVDRVYPLADAERVLQIMTDSTQFGKLVLTLDT